MASDKRTDNCFVIMPVGGSGTEEERHFSQIYQNAILPICDLPGLDIEFYRADVKLRDFDLLKGVHNHLDEADFCIVDITGLKANVLYELGYARAKSKQTIVISQDGPPYPVDIQSSNILEYQVSDDMAEEDWRQLAQSLAFRVQRAIDLTRYRALRPDYEVPASERRPSEEINEAIRNAKEYVDILQMDLDSISSEHLQCIVESLRKNPKLRARMLTLDPDGNYIAGREHQLGIRINQYRTELHRNIREVLGSLAEFPLQFSLRIYNEYPTQITFRVDDQIWVCTIAKNFRSRELCTFKLRTDQAGVERSFISQFHAIWTISSEYQTVS